jgi:hypothetical protein
MIVVGAEYKGDPSWEVPPVDYFDASLHQPRLNFHRRASRTDSLPAVARADQQTLLLPSPDHGHASLPGKRSLTPAARFRPQCRIGKYGAFSIVSRPSQGCTTRD